MEGRPSLSGGGVTREEGHGRAVPREGLFPCLRGREREASALLALLAPVPSGSRPLLRRGEKPPSEAG